MGPSREEVLARLGQIDSGDGRDLVSRGLVRALEVAGDTVRFVVEVASPEEAQTLKAAVDKAENALRAMDGVDRVSIALTAPVSKPVPQLKVGGHATKAPLEPANIGQIDRIVAVGSGKGGVGKSTVASNLAVALARQGRRVGLLDADIYGPSQPRMMGATARVQAPDGKTMIPLKAHGVTLMSLGFMVPEEKAIVWRGPMLMGALQQMLGQVAWGKLDVLLVDLPPGTGDVALTLCQKSEVTGAIIVSTPQDVALLDARKAVDMFKALKTPVLGLIENMSGYVCPKCGFEEHIFGAGGVAEEAKALGVPLLGQIPLTLATRLAGDEGAPIALEDRPEAEHYAQLAARLVGGGMA